MDRQELHPNGDYIQRDPEGEQEFWGAEYDAERRYPVEPPVVSRQIQLALLGSDVPIEYRQPLKVMAETGLLGEGAEIIESTPITNLIGQMALEIFGRQPDFIDESARTEISPYNPAVIAEGLREGLKIVAVDVEQTPDGVDIDI